MKENILIVEDEFLISNHLRNVLESHGYQVCGVASGFSQAVELIDSKMPTWVFLDIFLQGKSSGLDLAPILARKGIPFIFLSGSTSREILELVKSSNPYGFLSKPLKEWELVMMLDIARYRHKSMIETRDLLKANFDKELEKILVSAATPAQKLESLGNALQTLIRFDVLAIPVRQAAQPSGEYLYLQRTGVNEYRLLSANDIARSFGITRSNHDSISEVFFNEKRISYCEGAEFTALASELPLVRHIKNYFKVSSRLVLPLDNERARMALVFFSVQPAPEKTDAIYTLKNAEVPLVRILEQVFAGAGKQSTAVKPVATAGQRQVLPPKTDSDDEVFNNIVGHSPQLYAALDSVRIVAKSDASVLITGESGTGKEQIAKTIHALSSRKTKPFVVINCAALSVSLIESELFGHEKGAFTGASDRRVGKFEQADGGTVFLDEIGELPLESQAKLLRVLQEREFERVGSNQRMKVNIRIVAATNRIMEKEVAEGKFRLDLFYRLNVFPVDLPALRERKSDIPELVDYFLRLYSAENGKTITGVSPLVMDSLMSYHWPGNIRELSHLVERSVLLATSNMITEIRLPKGAAWNPLVKDLQTTNNTEEEPIRSFDENERDHILRVLKKSSGKVAGPGGAASILGVPVTTLNSKMKKLGIFRKHRGPE